MGISWQGRRVFVTGHTGFKGAWLSALLHRLGAEVTGYALAPPSQPNMYEAIGVASFTRSVIADIRDAGRLKAEMAESRPEVVFHLAAQALVRRARADPDETFETNVMGTVRVLDAVRAMESVKAAVIVTSDKVYDNLEWEWAYRESDRFGGKEPYGASKAACEIVLQAYRHSYFQDGPPVASARAGNVIGGGDWAEDRIVPDAVRAFSSGQPLVVRNPAAVRPWQHVLEPLTGYRVLAEALLEGRALPADVGFNFGPEASDATPVSAIADELADLWGEGASWKRDPAVQPYEARLLEVDSSRARAVLGWKPRWRLAQALLRTVEWYRDFYRGEDIRRVTLAQIEEHLDG